MYEFIRGPLLWFALIVFSVGIIFRIFQFFLLTRKKERNSYYSPQNGGRYGRPSSEGRTMKLLIPLKNSVFGSHSGVTLAASFFHILIFLVPISLLAHNNLLFESWNIHFLSFSETTSDVMTIVFLFFALFFLLRRIRVSQVRALTNASDYLVLLVSVAPFLTGFMCYHQWFDYHTVLIIHILAAELMLMIIAFTKLGHMVFFFLARFFIGSEFSFGRGTRTW